MIISSIIPLAYYTPVFYNLILLVVFFAIVKVYNKGISFGFYNRIDQRTFLLMISVVLYMGLRPISGRYFGDMGTYSRYFEEYAFGEAVVRDKDLLFHYFMKFSSHFMSVNLFFLSCAYIYIFAKYKATKNWLKENNYYLFLMMIASFSFWAYGVNGIRNGIATSLFLLGLSYGSNKKTLHIGLIISSYFVHSSLIIPIAAYVLSILYKKPKYYLVGWLLSIPISLALGSSLETFVAAAGFEDDRVSYLTDGNINDDSFAYTGFRWDFLVYSASAIFTGYYFIIKKNFRDKQYIQLFNIYVTANAFWILIIRANFSNRFAYLSWFLMPVVIFYPFLKQELIRNQRRVLVYAMLAYFGFTYLMFLIN